MFDFDGTLIASAIDFARMRERVREHLCDWGVGEPPPDLLVLETIVWAQGRLSADGQAAAYHREAEELLWEIERPACEVAAPFPGVPAALGRAQAAGLALGVITRNSRRGVAAVLSRHPLPLSVLLTRDDLTEVKPHPRHALLAVETLGVEPGRALLVGDHPTDIQCGRAAGLLTAAVLTTGGSPERFRELGADLLYPDAAALLADLLDGREA